MSDNKMMLILVLGTMVVLTLGSIFGVDDSESTRKIKAQEKTKQMQLQFRIDSLKAVQGSK